MNKLFKLSTLCAAVAVSSVAFAAETTTYATSMNDATQTLPPAKPGQCFAKVIVPAKYKVSTERLLAEESSSRIEIIPAKYQTVTEQRLVSEASTRLETIPAKYKTVTEQILVSDASTSWRIAPSSSAAVASSSLLQAAQSSGVNLDGARPGQCFYEHASTPKYKTESEQVLVREAATRIETVPAKYQTVTERVLVEEESFRLVEVPATYETVTERILVEPAKTVWKRGEGPITRVDSTTGEIMCLVEVPAKYTTVTKRVVKTPATTKRVAVPARYENRTVQKLVTPASERTVTIPAEYKTVTKTVKVSDGNVTWNAGSKLAGYSPTGNKICLVQTPAEYKTVTKQVVASQAMTRTVEIPAKYETVSVRKLVTPASERVIEIPAKYTTVTKRELVSDQSLEWREILCETNTTGDVVRRLQTALKNEGLYKGPIDGIYGPATTSAVASYQRKNGMATGGLTLATLQKLGVAL